MNKLIRSTIISILLAILLYFAVSLYSGGAATLQAITQLPKFTWLIILLLSLANYLLRYWRWQAYIAFLGQPRLPHGRHLAMYIAGFALTMTPGKAGEAMRGLYLKQQGVTHQASFAALLVERIIDLLAMLILAMFGLSLFSDSSVAQLAAIAAGIIIIVCIAVVKTPWQKVMQQPWFARLPAFITKLIAFLTHTLAGANQLLAIKPFLLGLTIGVLAWGLEGLGLFYVMQVYQPVDINLDALASAAAVYALAIIIGALAFLPGGLGGTEATMIILLRLLGFDLAAATAITLICRIATLWFAVLLGMVVILLMHGLGHKLMVTNN